MVLRSKKNEYRGVNAHLHSYFQAKGGWSSFHTAHINDLAREINRLLPQGYLVDVEQSLQIKEIHPDTGETLLRPQPDVTIYQTELQPETESSRAPLATMTRPLLETLELTEDVYYGAVVIYYLMDDDALGQPVTRIEVLSPTNKFGSGYIQYRDKRNIALKSGVCLVEIDYLHETESPVQGIASYPRHQTGAYPYMITVSNPSPDLEHGRADITAFSVDEPIPRIDVPLADGVSFRLDVNLVYETTFGSLTAYSHRVDYAQLPEHFETYISADQQRIRQVMARVARN